MSSLLGTAPHRVVADFAGEERLSTDLEDCADGVVRAVADDVPIIAEAVADILAGGKRLRPLLALATAYAGETERERSIRSGVVVELLHVASLVHDDVMDEASRRHGVTSANARMATVLKAKGYQYQFVIAAGAGHVDGKVVAQTLPHALEWLWRGYSSATK